MKKHILFFAGILLLLAPSSLSAQSSNNVKKLIQSIRSHKNIEVSFTYQTKGDSELNDETKEGRMYFQNDAYKLIMEDQHVISDGKTTWHYIVEDEEVMVGNATENDNPYTILDDLERDSSDLHPTLDSKGNLKSLEIIIDEGITLTINIVEMKFDQDFPKGLFTFDEKAYPGVELIDMR